MTAPAEGIWTDLADIEPQVMPVALPQGARSLPFTFAKQYGVLLDESGHEARLGRARGAAGDAGADRVAPFPGWPFPLQGVPEAISSAA